MPGDTFDGHDWRAPAGTLWEMLLSAPQGVQDDPSPHPTLNTDPSGPRCQP